MASTEAAIEQTAEPSDGVGRTGRDVVDPHDHRQHLAGGLEQQRPERRATEAQVSHEPVPPRLELGLGADGGPLASSTGTLAA
ncbi:hypothetical protein [Nocardioides marmoribigeumensis]|uniref:Uncharacterized protein n=1 Tax=Nocardioides marmoribigeumensis TaxID=433649 RepID=A0ABU2BY54_9ACTN|nr:hypothetical protein [Nocardioides marmoribigeumensis]MDR7363338.1 hypothetical protein [Nocardioides marmoribigeumensis]